MTNQSARFTDYVEFCVSRKEATGSYDYAPGEWQDIVNFAFLRSVPSYNEGFELSLV